MIAKILGISRNTVQSYLSSLESHFPDLSELQTWSDEALNRFIHLSAIPTAPSDKSHAQLYKSFEGYEKELAKPGVSRYTLWMEYRQAYPAGIKYSQFCTRFRTWRTSQQTVMHLEHKAAEKLFVDFAGKKLYLTNADTGEIIPVEFFVAILPCSQLSFAIAVPTQQKADFIWALQQTFEYMGGIPQAIVPDNLKTAVIKADRYEAQVNETMEDWTCRSNRAFEVRGSLQYLFSTYSGRQTKR